MTLSRLRASFSVTSFFLSHNYVPTEKDFPKKKANTHLGVRLGLWLETHLDLMGIFIYEANDRTTRVLSALSGARAHI